MSLIGRQELSRVATLPPAWKANLKRAQIHTMEDLFSLSELDMMEALDMHLHEVQCMLTLISSRVAPPPVSAWDLLEQTRAQPFLMDQNAPSTLINRGITELVGPPGLGKTQWCFSVCAKAFLPLASGGLGGGTIWIDTEGAFSVDRLVEVAQTRHPEYFAGQKERVRDFAHSVMHKKLVGEKDMHIALLNALGKVEELILAQNLKLLVIDGIAATVRTQTDRHETLGQIASALKLLSEKLNIAVIVTNQVTTKWTASKEGAEGTVSSRAESHLVAALGIGWSHAVNTRLLLEMDAESRRLLKVAKSPMFPFETFQYEIDSRGANIVEGSATREDTTTQGSVHGMTMHNTNHMTIGTRK